MIPHFPYSRRTPARPLVTEPEPTPPATAGTTARATYAQFLQDLREESPAPKVLAALPLRPPIDPITKLAREAADEYDKRTGHDWTEYGLIDAVLAAVTPAIKEGR